MRTFRWFTSRNLHPHPRILIAGALVSAGVGMALLAAGTSGPLLLGKSDGKGEAKREARFGRSNAFMSPFQTRLGLANGGEGERFDGAAQEAYDNRAYPNKWIGAAEAWAAANAANAVGKVAGVSTSATFAMQANWEELGPSGVHASGLVANESTAGTAATFYSGRVTAIAIAPTCNGNDCKIFIGAAGGGVWVAGNALASQPNWHPSNRAERLG